MTVNADDAVTDFPPFKHFPFSCTSTFLDDGKTPDNPGYIGVKDRTRKWIHPFD